MHPDTQQLLAFNDGDAPDAVAAHIDGCAHCRASLSALAAQRQALRELPDEMPPPPAPALFDVTSVKSVCVPAARSGRRSWFALAATVALVGLSAVWLLRGGAPESRELPLDSVVIADATVTKTAPASAVERSAARALSSQDLMLRSAELEQTWRALSRRPRSVQRLAYTERSSQLKARVSLLDARHASLSADVYWQQRVDLMDALVTMEQAERLADISGYELVQTRAPRAPYSLN